jgi:hypothetical protein
MFPIFGPDVQGSTFNPALITVGDGLDPQSVSSSGPGNSFDTNGKTGAMFAIQQVGQVPAASVTGKLQSSPDNATWTDIAGAAFTTVSSANNIQALAFTSPARYVRYYCTITGIGPYVSCSIIAPNQ